MTQVYDVVVVGAGPYGLSTAAHLLGRGLKVAVFGKPLGMWRDHMPKGMLLRSHWWATNLSDPQGKYGFGAFFQDSQYEAGYPLPIDAFIDYGLWFQQRAVPDVDETFVSSIARQGSQFLVTLQDGREVLSRAVVMAIGLHYYANRPEPFAALPAEFVSHSADHRDFAPFRGRDVIVIGGGQSAIEYTALLAEAGATVQTIARRRILWLAPDRTYTRSRFDRLLAPDAGVAPGWPNWVLDHMPYLFHRLPQSWKDWYNGNYESGATDWLRDRVIGKVTLRPGRTVARVTVAAGRVDATLADGLTLRADHVVLATGFKVNLERLQMIQPSLRASISTDRGIPRLSQTFESSVPGLYFVGATSIRAFGPLYRFVAGCGAAARQVARAVARGHVGQRQATAVSPSPGRRAVGVG